MATAKQVEQLSSRKERVLSESRLLEYHVYGSKNVKHVHMKFKDQILKIPREYEKDPYTQIQNFLYRRAMFGLKIYFPQEIQTMHAQKRERIRKTHKRTQTILNLWKQELVGQMSNQLFEFLFPKSPFTQALVEESIADSEYKNTIPFELLGISKDQIIAKLHSTGVLPKNFYSLG